MHQCMLKNRKKKELEIINMQQVPGGAPVREMSWGYNHWSTESTESVGGFIQIFHAKNMMNLLGLKPRARCFEVAVFSLMTRMSEKTKPKALVCQCFGTVWDPQYTVHLASEL